jgi:hypothetical protein
MAPSSTILLWRDPAEGNPCGAAGLLHWQSFTRRAGDDYYAPHGEPGQLGQLARAALGDALKRNMNVLVGWQAENPETTPAVEVEAAVRRLWPCTIICPERAIDGDRWVMSAFGEAATFPKAAIERTIDEFLSANMPMWQPGAQFRAHAVILRVDTSAEALGIVPAQTPTPDDIYMSVAEYPEVRAAGSRWDRATPSTHRDLVAAVLAAQERAGVAAADRVPLSSGAVEEYLTPLLMRAGKGDEPDVIAQMRRDTRRLYGEFAEIVLQFMLRTYRHRDTSALLAIATVREAA